MTAAGNRFAQPERAEQFPTRSAEDYLAGGASVAAKWPKEGFTVEGDLIGWSAQAIQQTDMNTGEPLYWENKRKTKKSELRNPELSLTNPCLQVTMDLQCEPTGITWKTNRYIKEAVPDDDGVRTMYVSGQLNAALRKARQAAAQQYKLGVRLAPLEAGAHVRITRGEDKKFGNDMFGHTYEAEWIPAAHNPNYQNSQLDSTGDPWDTGSSTAEDDAPPF